MKKYYPNAVAQGLDQGVANAIEGALETLQETSRLKIEVFLLKLETTD